MVVVKKTNRKPKMFPTQPAAMGISRSGRSECLFCPRIEGLEWAGQRRFWGNSCSSFGMGETTVQLDATERGNPGENIKIKKDRGRQARGKEIIPGTRTRIEELEVRVREGNKIGWGGIETEGRMEMRKVTMAGLRGGCGNLGVARGTPRTGRMCGCDRDTHGELFDCGMRRRQRLNGKRRAEGWVRLTTN